MSCPTVRLRLFGEFQVWVGADQPVALRLKRAHLLLAYLALAPSRRAGREELMTLLWSERDDVQARQSLRQTIAVIRRSFSATKVEFLRTDSDTVAFDPAMVDSDVTSFSLLARKSAIEDLEAAVNLYAGDFLLRLQVRDPCAEDWITERRGELAATLLRCLGSLLVAYKRLERLDDIERIATRILGFDSLDEEAHRALISVHLARGQRTLAFRQLQRCRENLRELSVKPSRETEELLGNSARVQIVTDPAPAQRVAATDSRSQQRPVNGNAAAKTQNGSYFERRRGPSVLVTEFDVLGEEPRSNIFAYGLVDDIVIDLSRFSSLFVLPPGPAKALNLHPIEATLVGSTLAVRYVLTGSVQVIDGRVRVASMLLDAESGGVVWGEHYDRRLIDFIGVRDDLARRIAVAASGAADTDGFDRMKSFDTNNLGAWELRALAQRSFLAYSPDQNAEARLLFGRALALEPTFLRAQVGLGWTHFEDFTFGWSSDPQKSLQKSYELASEASASDPRLYSAKYLLSYVHFVRRQFDEAIDSCARARADNPNDPEVLLHEGHLLACTGRAKIGIDRVEEALSLDPSHPNWFHYVHALTAFEADRFETALTAVNRYIEAQHGPFVGLKASALRMRAASNALSGRLDAARCDASDYLALNRGFLVSNYVRGMPRRDPTSIERMSSGLRLAGLPA